MENITAIENGVTAAESDLISRLAQLWILALRISMLPSQVS